MDKLILFHGTPDKIVAPSYGKGEEKHDYGRGFHLTESIDLAKEWAVCRPNDKNGWVHKYQLDTAGLKILNLQEKGVLARSNDYEGLLAKFTQNEDLEYKLKSTEEAILAECAVKDLIWSVGLSIKDPDRLDKTKWKGQNLLGYTLMMVRERL